MSTTLQKPQEVERRWYIIDAAGKPVGRTATKVANLLRGKNKPTFTPNVDCGDHVIVINSAKPSSPARSSMRRSTIITASTSADSESRQPAR
jgi:ribosomal protein L13